MKNEKHPYAYRCYDYSVLSRKAYKEFCKANPEVKIKKNEYDLILRTYGQLIANYIIDTGETFKPPFGIPGVYILKYKPKKYQNSKGEIKQRRSIDWQKTKEYGKKIYTFNSHTDGYITIFGRNNREGNIWLNEYWVFKGVRYSNRALARKMKSEDRYRALSNYREILALKNDI